jgi:hypothetical protein
VKDEAQHPYKTTGNIAVLYKKVNGKGKDQPRTGHEVPERE